MTHLIKSYSAQLLLHCYSDRAVFYTLLSRFLSICFGPLVILAVGVYLNPKQQGVYYVFGSLLQLRSLIDLGFSPSTQQLLSNRFSNLIFSREGLHGEKNRLDEFLNLSKFTLKIYVWIGFITIFAVGLLGENFLSSQLDAHSDISWRGAWWLMIVCVGLGNSALGVTVIADGANQVVLTNKWRFWNELSSLCVFVVVLFLGGGLWASAAMAFTRLWLIFPILYGMGNGFRNQICSANTTAVSFRKTILPLQSKMMVVWVLSFVCYYAYNPFSLHFVGPVFAGVIGMSMQISNMTSSLSLVWYNTKISRLGNLAGNNDVAGAIALNKKGAIISMALWLMFAICAWTATFLLKSYFPTMGARIAPLGSITIFLISSGAFIWCHIRGSFIRAFCVELFVPLAITQGVGTVVLLWLFIPRLGFYGPSLTALITMVIGVIWVEIGYRSFLKKQVFKCPANNPLRHQAPHF